MIEAVEGRDLAQVVAERIIEPLGLRSFSVGVPLDASRTSPNCASWASPRPYEEMAAVLGDFDPTLLARCPPTRADGVQRAAVRASACRAAAASVPQPTWRCTTRRCCTTRWASGTRRSWPTPTGHIRCTLADPMTGVPSNRSASD